MNEFTFYIFKDLYKQNKLTRHYLNYFGSLAHTTCLLVYYTHALFSNYILCYRLNKIIDAWYALDY